MSKEKEVEGQVNHFSVGNVTPIFRMFDVEKAREFYLEHLGFTMVFEHRFGDVCPLYMGLQRDGCSLHLSEHHGDANPGSSIRVEVSNIDSFHAAVTSHPYRYAKPEIEDQPWGSREVSVNDPFGNRIVFFQTP
eukprot:CAMPEP_0196718832 /NCGR_PEP_ID=MMETSP1091-20130531/1926_1 /TAXON_ID=302021 /ORGANISM="Rhodomonas sp., Strain CCMP768" /LENGTH=133 /DNA_ID=CAMNT_0042059583 /DNA_START=60 /DNA_END=461 /DNA_ORIENTATION=+